MKITKENYEAFLLDKAEGNLKEEELKELDYFFKMNPLLKPKEDEYDNSIKAIYNRSIHYPNTESLLRNPPKRIPFTIKVISIAACFAIVVIISLFVINKQNKKEIVQQKSVEIIKTYNNKPIIKTKKIKKITNNYINCTNKLQVKNKKKKVLEKKLQTSTSETIIQDDKITKTNQLTEEKPILIKVDNLITYETSQKRDTIFIYTNQLINYNEKKHKRRLRFYFPSFQPITINLASLER